MEVSSGDLLAYWQIDCTDREGKGRAGFADFSIQRAADLEERGRSLRTSVCKGREEERMLEGEAIEFSKIVAKDV